MGNFWYGAVYTKHEGCLAIRFRKWKRGARGWVDDECTVDGGSEPRAMSVPPQCPDLALDCETVRVTISGSDWALGHEFRTISPSSSHLPHTMPVFKKKKEKFLLQLLSYPFIKNYLDFFLKNSFLVFCNLL